MIPIICQVAHKPDENSYGDCFRACVASILEIEPPTDVPHFYVDGETISGHHRINEYLASRKLTRYLFEVDCQTLEEALAEMANIHGHYILCGSLASGGTHAVVCKGNAVVHDPNWVRSPLVGPLPNGKFAAMVIAVA